MLYDLGSANSQNEEAIRYWQAELRSARGEKKLQDDAIKRLTPITEEAGKAYSDKLEEHDDLYEEYEDHAEDADKHLVSMWWLAYSLHAYYKSIVDYMKLHPKVFSDPSGFEQQMDHWKNLFPSTLNTGSA